MKNHRYIILSADRGGGSQLRSKEYYSKVRDLSGHMDFTYDASNMHQIRFGVKGTRYRFEPGTTLEEINMGEQGSWQIQNGADTIRATQLTTYVEGFYKEMQNLVEYAEGEEMQMHDNNWESIILYDPEFLESLYQNNQGNYPYN